MHDVIMGLSLEKERKKETAGSMERANDWFCLFCLMNCFVVIFLYILHVSFSSSFLCICQSGINVDDQY